jgi:hypothetical protein
MANMTLVLPQSDFATLLSAALRGPAWLSGARTTLAVMQFVWVFDLSPNTSVTATSNSLSFDFFGAFHCRLSLMSLVNSYALNWVAAFCRELLWASCYSSHAPTAQLHPTRLQHSTANCGRGAALEHFPKHCSIFDLLLPSRCQLLRLPTAAAPLPLPLPLLSGLVLVPAWGEPCWCWWCCCSSGRHAQRRETPATGAVDVCLEAHA